MIHKMNTNLITKYLILSFSIMFSIALITYAIHPNIQSIVNSIPVSNKTTSSSEKLMFYFVSNGIKVPRAMFLLAFIPIPFLYLFNLVLSSALGGIVYGSIFSFSLHKGMIMLVSAFPHMFIELLAFSIWASSLYYLNNWVRNKLFKKPLQSSFLYEIKRCLCTYLVYVIPLIILAAILETFIASMILSLIS